MSNSLQPQNTVNKPLLQAQPGQPLGVPPPQSYGSVVPSVGANLANAVALVQKQFGKPTVTAPPRTNFTFTAPSAAGSFQAPQQITAQQVAGKDPQYFQELLNAGQKQLQSQYFGPGGVEQKVTENLVSRGLVGQGPEQDIRQQQIFNPFQQSITDLSSKLLAEQLQNQYEVNKFNAEQNNQVAVQNQQAMLDAAKAYSTLVNSDNLALLEAAKTKATLGQKDNELNLKAQQIQAGIDQSYADLASKIATAQTDADLKQISQQIAAYQAAVDAAYKQGALQVQYLGLEGLNYGDTTGGTSTVPYSDPYGNFVSSTNPRDAFASDAEYQDWLRLQGIGQQVIGAPV